MSMNGTPPSQRCVCLAETDIPSPHVYIGRDLPSYPQGPTTVEMVPLSLLKQRLSTLNCPKGVVMDFSCPEDDELRPKGNTSDPYDLAIAFDIRDAIHNSPINYSPKLTVYIGRGNKPQLFQENEEVFHTTILSSCFESVRALTIVGYPGNLSHILQAFRTKAQSCRIALERISFVPMRPRFGIFTHRPVYTDRLGMSIEDVRELAGLIRWSSRTLTTLQIEEMIFVGGLPSVKKHVLMLWRLLVDAISDCLMLRRVTIEPRTLHPAFDNNNNLPPFAHYYRVFVLSPDLCHALHRGERMSRILLAFPNTQGQLSEQKREQEQWKHLVYGSVGDVFDLYHLFQRRVDLLLSLMPVIEKQYSNSLYTPAQFAVNFCPSPFHNSIKTAIPMNTRYPGAARIKTHVSGDHITIYLTARAYQRHDAPCETTGLRDLLAQASPPLAFSSVSMEMPSFVPDPPKLPHWFMRQAHEEEFALFSKMMKTIVGPGTSKFLVHFDTYSSPSNAEYALEDRRIAEIIRLLPRTLTHVELHGVHHNIPCTLAALRLHFYRLQKIVVAGPSIRRSRFDSYKDLLERTPFQTKPKGATRMFMVGLTKLFIAHCSTLQTFVLRQITFRDPRMGFYPTEITTSHETIQDIFIPLTECARRRPNLQCFCVLGWLCHDKFWVPFQITDNNRDPGDNILIPNQRWTAEELFGRKRPPAILNQPSTTAMHMAASVGKTPSKKRTKQRSFHPRKRCHLQPKSPYSPDHSMETRHWNNHTNCELPDLSTAPLLPHLGTPGGRNPSSKLSLQPRQYPKPASALVRRTLYTHGPNHLEHSPKEDHCSLHGNSNTGFDSSISSPRIASTHFGNNCDNVLQSEHVTDIIQRLYQQEADSFTGPYHTRLRLSQSDRTAVFQKAIAWHQHHRMQEVTLHLCVAIMDRFLASIQYIDKEKLELVMIASLRLAATIEEDTVLSLPCAQQKFSGSDILDMEKYILKTLKHVIQVPSAFPFLFRFLELVDATDRQRSIATYYLETSILNFHFHQYRPSILAYCSALLAINNPFFRTGQAPGVVRLLNPSRSGYPVTKTSRIIFTPPQPRALETYAGFELSLALKIMSEMCDTFRTCTLASSIIRLRYRGLILPDASPRIADVTGYTSEPSNDK